MTNKEFIESIRIDGEEWRDVVGYEGRYIVSSLGRVAIASHDCSFQSSYSFGKVTKVFHIEPKLIATAKNQGGYMYTSLYGDNKRKRRFTIHKLVGTAFIPNPLELPCLNHINEDKTDNRVENLEWCSYKFNNNHGTRNKRISENTKQMHVNGQMDMLYQRKSKPVVGISIDGNSILEFDKLYIANLNGYNRHYVAKCCKKLIPNYKGYIWMWKSDYETLISMSKNSTDLSAD